jgi:glycosyltransferase involved in cell wall biosynthesis
VRDTDRQTIVHAHGIRAAAVALPAAALRRSPLVITIHGLHSIRGGMSQIRLLSHRIILGRARQVLVLSESDRGALGEAQLVRPERITKVTAGFRHPGPADREAVRRHLGIQNGSLAIAWLGRFSREKDPVTFVRALRQMPNRSHFVGLMGGGGPLRRAVTDCIDGDERIVLLGPLVDGAELMAAADVFVSTSRWEGLPLAVLEAASARLPLVLTDVPGNRDVAREGVPAVLVPPDDPEAIAHAIGEMTSERRARMGIRASRAVGRVFSVERLAQDVLVVYSTIARPAR